MTFFGQFVRTHQEDIQALEQELHTITQALKLAFLRRMDEPFLQGTLALLPFLERRRLYTLADTLLAQAQQVASQAGDRESQARTWLFQGRIAELRGDVQAAQLAYFEGLKLARQLNQEELIAHLLVLAAGTLIDTEAGKRKQAETYLIESLRVIEKLDDDAPRCLVFQYLGELADNLGEMEKAASFYQQGLSLARQTQNWTIAGALLQDLGYVEERKGANREAERLYQEGLVYAQQLHDRQRQSALLMNLGMLAWHQRQSEQAITLSLESLKLAREIEHQMRISSVLQNLGMMTCEQGHLPQAEAYLQESLAIAQHIGHRWLIVETLGEWGKLQFKQGRFTQAKTTFDEMHRQAREISAPLLAALALFGLAQVAEHAGEREQALEHAQASKAILDKLHNRIIYQEVEHWCASVLLSPRGTS